MLAHLVDWAAVIQDSTTFILLELKLWATLSNKMNDLKSTTITSLYFGENLDWRWSHVSHCGLHFLFFPELTPTAGYPVSPACVSTQGHLSCALVVDTSHLAGPPVISKITKESLQEGTAVFLKSMRVGVSMCNLPCTEKFELDRHAGDDSSLLKAPWGDYPS